VYELEKRFERLRKNGTKCIHFRIAPRVRGGGATYGTNPERENGNLPLERVKIGPLSRDRGFRDKKYSS